MTGDIIKIELIVERAIKVYEDLGVPPPNQRMLRMMLTDVHARYPMRLDEFLDGRLIDFTHDIGGILRHWNGEDFTDCFFPRFCLMRTFA